MIPLATLVQTTAYDLTPASSRMSSFLWTGFVALNKVHAAWRWYRRTEVYTNPNNLAHLLAGHAVNFFVGDVVILRVAAQCLLITTRLLDCVQQQAVVCQAGRSWQAAVMGHYAKSYYPSWESPYPMKSYLHTVWDRIQHIAICTFQVLIQTFRLSMSIMDSIDAFCLNPTTRNEAINEGFVNAMKWMDTAVKNKDELMRGIVSNRETIERFLQGSPLTYTQLHDGLEKTLEKTEVVYNQAKKISTFSNGALIKNGKRVADEVKVTLGLARFGQGQR